jgi:prepilin-type N-terminal cleavage/methylation domain-containing protein
MPRGPVPPAAAAPHPLGEGRGEGASRLGFSLVELLVVVSIILLLIGMVAAAVSAARATQKRQATQSLIAKLDAIVQQQYASYASRSVPTTALAGPNKSAARAAYLRKLASAELPDNWADVQTVASGTAGVASTAPQQAYSAVWNALTDTQKTLPGTNAKEHVNAKNSSAECLFMIVMQGGIADCLDCGELGSSSKGDTDEDGLFEFLDAWGKPINFVLWPAALELPPGSGRFFSTTAPFTTGAPAAAKGGTMRPLIFSGGPDGRPTTRVSEGGNFGASAPADNPSASNLAAFLAPVPADDPDPSDGRADNITNFDAEARK